MAERSTISQVVQIGMESVPGTKVRGNRRLLTLDFATDLQVKVDGFRPAGFKFETVSGTNKQWMEVTVKGQPTYTEVIYPLASAITTPGAPTQINNGIAADTGGRRWIFEPSSSGVDTPQTYTVEQGSSVRAHSFGYALFNDFNINITRDKTELGGKMLAQAITDPVTLSTARTSSADGVTTNSSPTVTSATAAFTALDVGSLISGSITGIPVPSYVGIVNSATSIGLSSSPSANVPVNATASTTLNVLTIGQVATSVPLIPLTAAQCSVYFDTTSAGLGTTKLARLFAWNFTLTNRFGPVWVVDASQASWAAHVEVVPTMMVKMTVEADAQGMGLLPILLANTTYFMRFLATGPIIYSAAAPFLPPNELHYTYQHDMAVQVRNAGTFKDEQGAYAIEFDLVGVHDATWGKAIHIEVVNKVTAL